MLLASINNQKTQLPTNTREYEGNENDLNELFVSSLVQTLKLQDTF